MTRLMMAMMLIILTARHAETDGPEIQAPQTCHNGACTDAAAPPRHGPWPLPCTLQPHVGFPAVASFETRPFVVASFLKWFDGQGFDPDEISNCSVPCLFLHLPSGVPDECVQMADLVLMTTSISPPPTSVKPAWQSWGYYSLESPSMYPEMENLLYMAQFDLEISTRLSSHVPISFAPRMANIIRRPLTEDTSSGALVLYLQSNCVEWRDNYVKELMSHVSVDSLGKCLKNGIYPDNVGTVNLLARYKFFIAFENSIANDFVTERVFNAWIAGAIPIYKGAPNIADFAPTRNSYIDATQFESAHELGRYLTYLHSNLSAYAEYLSYKDVTQPLSEGYLRASNFSFYSPNGEGGASVPFLTATMLDTSSSRMQGTSDKSCRLVNDLDEVVDSDGIPVLDPRSKCYEAHSILGKDHHRHNKIGACRICEAAHAAQLDLRKTHARGVEGGGGILQSRLVVAEQAFEFVKIKLIIMSKLVVPDDGYIILSFGFQGMVVRNEVVKEQFQAPVSLQFSFPFDRKQHPQGGKYVVKSQVVSTGRRVLSDSQTFVIVSPLPTHEGDQT